MQRPRTPTRNIFEQEQFLEAEQVKYTTPSNARELQLQQEAITIAMEAHFYSGEPLSPSIYQLLKCANKSGWMNAYLQEMATKELAETLRAQQKKALRGTSRKQVPFEGMITTAAASQVEWDQEEAAAAKHARATAQAEASQINKDTDVLVREWQ